ncbi:histone acetyltransferase [Blyttiomyces sp. JEL0837]|nr:histone acetyltransferase [Blyttiomyces sp. JEL0837]
MKRPESDTTAPSSETGEKSTKKPRLDLEPSDQVQPSFSTALEPLPFLPTSPRVHGQEQQQQQQQQQPQPALESIQPPDIPIPDNGTTAEPAKVEGVENVNPEEGKRKTTRAQKEEEEGLIQFRVVHPDKSDESMILLTGLKNIYQKQLPNMPKEYIARLVYDRNHASLAVVKPPLKVVGGITYRPFIPRKFAEIVFCAIASTEQVKGYGSRLMSHVKDYVGSALDVRYFLTYADNFAIGYFKKQGFTTEISLAKSVWVGYIKDYEGGTLMQCSMIPRVNYLNSLDLIDAQKKAVRQKIRETRLAHQVRPGLTAFQNGQTSIPPDQIPGLLEAGWTPEMQKLTVKVAPKPRGPLYTLMKSVVTEMQENPNAWPFVEPVSGVPDYYDIIKEPMDISTLTSCVENNEFKTLDEFVTNVNKIFNNCRLYNEEGTNYVKCANKLEKWFKERLKVLRAEMAFM